MYLPPRDPRVTDELLQEWLTRNGVDPDRYRTDKNDIVEGDKVVVIGGRGSDRRVCPVVRTTKTQIVVDQAYPGSDRENLVKFSRRSQWNQHMDAVGVSSWDRRTAEWIDERVAAREVDRELDAAEEAAKKQARKTIDQAAGALTSVVRSLSDASEIEAISVRLQAVVDHAQRVLAIQQAETEAARAARP